jgi:hypothetical protein
VKTRRFFFASLLFILCGLVAHLTAFDQGFRALDLRMRALKTPAEKDQLRAESSAIDRRAYAALYLGVACAAVSALLAFISYGAEEPAPRSIVVGLLLFYGILHFAVF